MIVAFFTNNYKPFVGGVPVAIENLAGQLRRRGHRVLIYAPEYEGAVEPEADVYRILSIKKFNDTSFSLPLPLTVRAHTDFTDEFNVDIVHVHHPFLLGVTGLRVARTHNIPVVFTYHTQYEKYTHYLPFSERMTAELAVSLSTRFANCCDAVIAPSFDIRETLLRRGVKVPIQVIPTGVDLQRFRGGDRSWLRNRYELPAEAPILLFVSRLAREKNVGFLLNAFAKLGGSLPEARLVLVGSGDAEGELATQAQELGVADRTIFAGTLRGRELVCAYKGADLFVFASTSETQGMVVAEAMAGGLPVVAVDAPGVRDIVKDGVNGFLVAEGNESEFVEKCLLLLVDHGCHEEIAEAAKDSARKLSLAKSSRRVESLYRRVILRPRTGGNERFLFLREFVRYQFDRFTEELEKILP
jgi:glycosyltransferase involved in cell wall biosynthesis